MPARNITAIAFDLDGTLVDSAPDLHAAVNHLMGKYDRGQIDLPTVRRMVGDGTPNFVAQAMEITGEPASEAALPGLIREYLEFYEANVSVFTRPFEGVMEMLEKLKASGYKLAVCTNKPIAPTRILLGDLDLARLFDVVGGGDSYVARKPDARHLLGVLGDLGVDPANAIMVGDNELDAAAAKGANVPMILLSHGYARVPLSEIPHDVLIDGFDDLTDAINRIAEGQTNSAA